MRGRISIEELVKLGAIYWYVACACRSSKNVCLIPLSRRGGLCGQGSYIRRILVLQAHGIVKLILFMLIGVTKKRLICRLPNINVLELIICILILEVPKIDVS